MLQNATPIRKSIPWPPNISHEHVSCTVLATRHASLWIFFKCHTPAIVFWISLQKNLLVLLTFGRVRNPLRLPRESTSERPKVVRDRDRHFLTLLTSKCASRHNGVHFFDISTSKSIRRLMCFAPQRRALFRHLNFQTCSEAEVLCACWLRNVLRATTACTFSTSQFPKVFRGWSALYILTSKCASRHNGVPLFNIATSESGPNPAVFNPWLRNVLGATTACNFSSLIWPDGSAPAALASLLFDPPEPQILWKTQWIATFLPFRAPASSFFWLFLFSDLLSSSLLFSSLLFSSLTLPTSAFPSVHIVHICTRGRSERRHLVPSPENYFFWNKTREEGTNKVQYKV